MKLSEANNLTYEELKSDPDGIAAQIAGEAQAEFALRYVRLLIDAKLRDVRLGENAITAKAQADANGLLMTRVAELEGRLAALHDDHEAICVRAAETQLALQQSQACLAQESARGDRNQAEAIRNHAAVIQAAGLLNSAIAAQQIEAANKAQ